MKYGQILKKAYHLTKKNKILWLLGLLVGGGSSCGGSMNYSADGSEFEGKLNGKLDEFSIILSDVFVEFWYLWALVGLLILLLIIVAVVISVMARGGLYYGVAEAAKNKKAKFGKSFSVGASKFWRLLGIQILLGLAVMAVVFVVLIPSLVLLLIPIIGWIIMIFLIIAGIFVAMFVGIVVSLISNYAFCFAVLKDQGVIDSIKSALKLFRNNLGETILMGLILFGVNIGVGLVILLVIIIIGLLFAAIGFGFYFLLEWIGVAMVVIVAIFVLFLIAMFVRGVVNVFMFSSWYYTWKELVDKK